MKTLNYIILYIIFFSHQLWANNCPEEKSTILSPQIEEMRISFANQAWTHDDQFEGDVVVFSSKIYLKELDTESVKYFIGKIETDVQLGGDGIEHAYLHVKTISLSQLEELKKDGRFHIINKGIDLGNVQVSRDLPLAQTHYIELEPVKIYGTIGFSPSENSNWEFLARAALSFGYALAESTKPEVQGTNNFYVGQDWGLSLRHKKFGQIDFDRGVDGDVKKYDSESTTSREAYVKVGYTYHFNDKNSVSIAGEKRSFRFGPDYEKSRRYLITYQRKFK